MTETEKLDDDLTAEGVIVDDRLLGTGDPAGLYLYKRGKPPLVLLNRHLSGRRKLCVLAEEAGHHHKSCGPALDSADATQRRNELSGRRWAYKYLLPMERLVEAWAAGSREAWEMAAYCGVTEEFLLAAVEYYHSKFGTHHEIVGWMIQFDPFFRIRRVSAGE